MANVVVAAAPPPPPPPPKPSQKQTPVPPPPNPPAAATFATTIVRSPPNISITPAAVAIGPYHRGSPHLLAMEAAKSAAADEFCRSVGRSFEQVYANIFRDAFQPETARSCYDQFDEKLTSIDDGELAKMLLLDGCFLVQFMVSAMCTEHPPGEEQDPLMSRPEVYTHIYDIARDVLLPENQIPWAVLKALMDLRQGVPVTEFLDRMASAFDISSSTGTKPSSDPLDPQLLLPHHLLGLFHRHHPLRRPPLPPQPNPPAAVHFHRPVRRSSATTIERISARLPSGPPNLNISTPAAVAIGPYHHGTPNLLAMEATKRAAADEFCWAVGRRFEQVYENIFPLAETARSCYDQFDEKLTSINDTKLEKMLLVDGCFLVQFMVSIYAQNQEQPPLMSRLMSRAEVHTRIHAIARDLLLLENQIPWAVLHALMDLRLGDCMALKVLTEFLDRMASAFDISSSTGTQPSSESVRFAAQENALSALLEPESPAPHHLLFFLDGFPRKITSLNEITRDIKPHHLLGLFHRRQVGKVRTQSLRIDILPSPGSTAVELAEMGVKLTASKIKSFGDMKMSKHRWMILGLFGELSLAPLVLNHLTACWLLNMAAYEACLGATQADNFAVSSYVSVVALLVNRGEDVQELRARGIINSAMSDEGTLSFFKWAAPCLRVGERYFDISQSIQQYKEKRWIRIAIHRFFYRYMKTIVAVVSVVGALAGLLKLIPARS